LNIHDAALSIGTQIRRSIRSGNLCMVLEKEDGKKVTPTKTGFFRKNKSLKKILEEPKYIEKTTKNSKKETTNEPMKSVKSKTKLNSNKNMAKVKVFIGDVIDLDQSPWNEPIGLYPSQTKHRPEFAESAIAACEVLKSVENASSTRSHPQTKNSIFQDSYLMLTNHNILEIKRPSNRLLWGNSASVTFVIPFSSLVKLQFSPNKGILLYVKEADDPLEYFTPHSVETAKQIQNIMKQRGIKSEHRSYDMEKARRIGLHFCSQISVRQAALGSNPSLNEVRAIIDLHCKAAEKLESANDDRHLQIISHMNKFLAKPKIARVLNGTSKADCGQYLQKKFSDEETVSTKCSSLQSDMSGSSAFQRYSDGEYYNEGLSSTSQDDVTKRFQGVSTIQKTR